MKNALGDHQRSYLRSYHLYLNSTLVNRIDLLKMGQKWRFWGKFSPKAVLMQTHTSKATTWHRNTLFKPLTTEICRAVWVVGSSKKRRKKPGISE
jgi:hypothetical protein